MNVEAIQPLDNKDIVRRQGPRYGEQIYRGIVLEKAVDSYIQ